MNGTFSSLYSTLLSQLQALLSANTDAKLRDSFQNRLVHCFINFNGKGEAKFGRDSISAADITTRTPEQAMAIRLLARAVLGVGTSDIESFIDPAEFDLLSVEAVLQEFANRKRRENKWNADDAIVMFLHVDELQLAQQEMANSDKIDKYKFVKEMVYTIGEYMYGMATKHNVFVVPLLVSTICGVTFLHFHTHPSFSSPSFHFASDWN
jgi:hypothetical protein